MGITKELLDLHAEIKRRDARIAELERELAGANATIALFMGPDGEKHVAEFAKHFGL